MKHLYITLIFVCSIVSNAFSLVGGIAGDNCEDPIQLSLSIGCQYTLFSTVGATSQSTSVCPNPNCGSYLGNDIWMTVTVPASGKLRLERDNVSGINAAYAVYTGSCGAFTQIACASKVQSSVLNGWTLNDQSLAGELLYVRVWNRNSTNGGTFNFCAFEPPTPENDLCSEAIELSVGTFCSYGTYTNAYCTEEAGFNPTPDCGFYQGGDVWFTLQMPASGHLRIERENTPGVNAQFALYSGVCGAMTELQCAQLTTDMNIHNESLAGQTLFLRVFPYNNNEGGLFYLCAWEPPIPDHDMCAEAIDLSIPYGCQMLEANNAYCTEEPGIAPDPDCLGFKGGDIWYKFVMPSSGVVNVEKIGTSTNSTGQFSFYSGTCGDMVHLDCAELSDQLTLDNPALGGQELYLRFYRYNNPQGGEFEFCIWTPPFCTGDFNGDGEVTTSDMLLFLGAFGCSSGCAPFDLTEDDAVNISDLLIFISLIGNECVPQ